MFLLLKVLGYGGITVVMGDKNQRQYSGSKDNAIRQRLLVTGVVQGVGFRPFIYGLALKMNLGGFVGNDSRGVFIEIEGNAETLAAFGKEMVDHPPPLAHIESVNGEVVEAIGELSFRIVHSQAKVAANTLISPDICICDQCHQELFDPQNRRYGYPFINCTNCGPRFSIIKDIPYDRPLTTMADFPMCEACQTEYEDPLDRRFHAQPNACAVCGPHVWLEQAGQSPYTMQEIRSHKVDSGLILAGACELLQHGKIVAVKGLGGFHLACNATDDDALQLLRERKGRVDKPFAVMALDMATVREFADLTPEEERYLESKERPIVLVQKRVGNSLSQLVAPGNRYVGVMLPYTPLHFLLLNGLASTREQMKTGDCDRSMLPVLVMTSGNYSDEPIVKGNEEARESLAGLADAFIFHNRDIHARCDDSVIRIVELTSDCTPQDRDHGDKTSQLLPIRRSRGYVPFPVKLPFEAAPILAVGGELKSTFCLAKAEYAYMSQHIGDMENLETVEAFEEAVVHFQHVFRTWPERIACDMHPRYLSTQWALRQEDVPIVQVQHHHAHIASVMAEHRLDGSKPVIGFSFDGTGYGPDGAVWGGEVLVADYRGFERVFHLKYVPLVGGDAAVRHPYRLALAHLRAAGIHWDDQIPSVEACSDVERGVFERQLEADINSVATSSMGRLFDAVASIAGVRQSITYEAQAAIEFEAMASKGEHGHYEFDFGDGVFDAAPVVRAAAQDVLAGVKPDIISSRFHQAVAHMVLGLSIKLRNERGLKDVAISGGVFQNVTLLSRTATLLQDAGFGVYWQRLVPPNDGGLALGQAVIAAHSI